MKSIKKKYTNSFRKNKKQNLRRNSRKSLKRTNLCYKNQRKRTLKGGSGSSPGSSPSGGAPAPTGSPMDNVPDEPIVGGKKSKIAIASKLWQRIEDPNSLVGKFKGFCKTNKSLPDFRRYACELIADEISIDPPVGNAAQIQRQKDVQSLIGSISKNWDIFTMFNEGGWYKSFRYVTGLDKIDDKGLRDLINTISDRDQCKIAFKQSLSDSNCALQNGFPITEKCYICGLPLNHNYIPEPKADRRYCGNPLKWAMECEHILPFMAGKILFSVLNIRDPSEEERSEIENEYAWSHRCCNQMKKDTLPIKFVTGTGFELDIVNITSIINAGIGGMYSTAAKDTPKGECHYLKTFVGRVPRTFTREGMIKLETLCDSINKHFETNWRLKSQLIDKKTQNSAAHQLLNIRGFLIILDALKQTGNLDKMRQLSDPKSLEYKDVLDKLIEQYDLLLNLRNKLLKKYQSLFVDIFQKLLLKFRDSGLRKSRRSTVVGKAHQDIFTIIQNAHKHLFFTIKGFTPPEDAHFVEDILNNYKKGGKPVIDLINELHVRLCTLGEEVEQLRGTQPGIMHFVDLIRRILTTRIPNYNGNLEGPLVPDFDPDVFITEITLIFDATYRPTPGKGQPPSTLLNIIDITKFNSDLETRYGQIKRILDEHYDNLNRKGFKGGGIKKKPKTTRLAIGPGKRRYNHAKLKTTIGKRYSNNPEKYINLNDKTELFERIIYGDLETDTKGLLQFMQELPGVDIAKIREANVLNYLNLATKSSSCMVDCKFSIMFYKQMYNTTTSYLGFIKEILI